MADVSWGQAIDPANPTCPANPNWSTYQQMRFTQQEVEGRQVLLAEGEIDEDLLPRLEAALDAFDGDEIWLRSPGGDAQIANQAGRLIRERGLSTHIPTGWVCYGACNFLFMGGFERTVADGGWFMVKTNPPFTIEGYTTEQRRAQADRIARQSAQIASQDYDFVLRMGVSTRLLSEVMYPRSANGSTRRCLTPQELGRYNLTSQVQRPVRRAYRDSAKPN